MGLSMGLRALYLSVFFLLAGNGLQNIFLVIYAKKMGFDIFTIGLMGSVYFIGYILGCLQVPKILRSVGHIRTFSAMAAFACCVTMLHALIHYPALWVLFRGVTGFCLAGLYLSIESWLSSFSRNDNRGQILSKYRLSDLAGTASGQLVLLAIPLDINIFFILAILIAMSLVPITMLKVQTPVLLETSQVRFFQVMKETWKTTPTSLTGCFLSGFANSSFWALVPIFVLNRYGSEKMVPVFMLLYLLGGALSQWPAGHLSDRIDRRLVIGSMAILASTSAFIWTLVISHFHVFEYPWSLLLLFAFGAGGIPIYALSVAHANDWAKRSSIVELSGLLLLVSSAGAVIGPVVCSFLVKAYGVEYLFAFLSSAHVVLVLIVLYRILFFKAAMQSDKSDFMDLPETTPMIAVVAKEIRE